MRLEYKVLWIEDDTSWYETACELLKDSVELEGFELVSVRKDSIDQVKDLIQRDNLQQFDMFLIDYTLKNSDSGDSIINTIRDNDIYTDVLFYSGQIDNISEIVKHKALEGVFTSDREQFENKFKAVFLNTTRKIQEVNAMRGLIMGTTSLLDWETEQIIIEVVNKFKINEQDLKQLIKEKCFDKLSRKVANFWTEYNDFSSFFPRVDAIKKWEILRSLLKPHKDIPCVKSFLDINSTYQDDVIAMRNIFAHVVESRDENDHIIMKADNNIVFDNKKCVEIRKKLIRHKNNLARLKDELF